MHVMLLWCWRYCCGIGKSHATLVQVDPLDDIDVINLELALADLSQIEKRMERLQKGEHLAASLRVQLAPC